MKRNEYNTKWIADLRSGNYKQCQGRLRRPAFADEPASYCCLGVAVESLGGDWGGFSYENYLSHRPDDTGLNDEARALLGLSPADEGTCISLNDALRRHFNEIADVIERAIEDDVSVTQAARALKIMS